MASYREFPDEIEEHKPLLKLCGLSELEFWFCVENEWIKRSVTEPTESEQAVLIGQLVRDGQLDADRFGPKI